MKLHFKFTSLLDLLYLPCFLLNHVLLFTCFSWDESINLLHLHLKITSFLSSLSYPALLCITCLLSLLSSPPLPHYSISPTFCSVSFHTTRTSVVLSCPHPPSIISHPLNQMFNPVIFCVFCPGYPCCLQSSIFRFSIPIFFSFFHFSIEYSSYHKGPPL
ncbi:hypothetical protein KDRO_B07650 [Kluyveromyces lactis]|nr:hypothetical protein KDRO_B07650 [Kluyveromyces lactis]